MIINTNVRYIAALNDSTNAVTMFVPGGVPVEILQDCTCYDVLIDERGDLIVSHGHVKVVHSPHINISDDVTIPQAVILFHAMIGLMESAKE
jgi:hypothetical protein